MHTMESNNLRMTKLFLDWRYTVIRSLFSIDKDLNNSNLILLRLLVGLGGISLFALRYRLFSFILSYPNLDAFLTVLIILLCGPCILLVYFAIANIVLLVTKKQKGKELIDQSFIRELSCDWILRYLSISDIAEIVVRIDDSAIKIGVSSDNQYSSSCFINKQFYINQERFDSEDKFCQRLKQISSTTSLNVLEIDGLPPTDDNFSFN